MSETLVKLWDQPDGHVGGPQDLEDIQKKWKSRHSVIFLEFAVGFAEFFFATGSGQGV